MNNARAFTLEHITFDEPFGGIDGQAYAVRIRGAKVAELYRTYHHKPGTDEWTFAWNTAARLYGFTRKHNERSLTWHTDNTAHALTTARRIAALYACRYLVQHERRNGTYGVLPARNITVALGIETRLQPRGSAILRHGSLMTRQGTWTPDGRSELFNVNGERLRP